MQAVQIVSSKKCGIKVHYVKIVIFQLWEENNQITTPSSLMSNFNKRLKGVFISNSL